MDIHISYSMNFKVIFCPFFVQLCAVARIMTDYIASYIFILSVSCSLSDADVVLVTQMIFSSPLKAMIRG